MRASASSYLILSLFSASKQPTNRGGKGRESERRDAHPKKESMVVVRADARVCKPSGCDAVASKRPAGRKGNREGVDASIESRGGGLGR